jgi:hypothetical protein
MSKNLKYIIAIAVVILIVVLLMSFINPRDSAETTAKKDEINKMFAIWTDTVGSGDKITLLQNEVAIKKDLFDKLNVQEINSIKTYSVALRDMMKAKSQPFSAAFLNSLAYLTTNFSNAKQIISKTNASNVFDRFGFGKINA